MALGSQPIPQRQRTYQVLTPRTGLQPNRTRPKLTYAPSFSPQRRHPSGQSAGVRTGRSRGRRSGRLVVRRCWIAGLPIAWSCACGLRPLLGVRRRRLPAHAAAGVPVFTAEGENWDSVRSGSQGRGTAASAPVHGAVAVESRPSGVRLFHAHCQLQDSRIGKKVWHSAWILAGKLATEFRFSCTKLNCCVQIKSRHLPNRSGWH
jgi:hypothetical protein